MRHVILSLSLAAILALAICSRSGAATPAAVAGATGVDTPELAAFKAAIREKYDLKEKAFAAHDPEPILTKFYAEDAMSVGVGSGGRIERARFAFGGVAAVPLRVVEAEAAADGQPWTARTVERVQQALAETLSPIGDHRGSKAYREHVSMSMIERFWLESTT